MSASGRLVTVPPFSPDYRASSLLLHVTSLPSPYGIGDVGPSAFSRVDCLHEAGQSWWQSLPLGPTGYGNLPYQPMSSATITATRDALETGFRHFDCAERYRNEHEVGEALQAGMAAGGILREDIFVTTKLWNTNHRPERVEPAFDANLNRLRLEYLDLYLIHTPFAFKAGNEQDPRDQRGNVLYDKQSRPRSRQKFFS